MIKIIDDPTPFTIDVLRMELEQKLPYWLSPEGKGLREDAMAANHTGAAVAGFDPLLRRRKRKERPFRRKRPILEADVEALPASGGVGETDMNSVVPKRKKFRIRHGKSLKEAYNPNEPREAKGTPHGGRWTRGGLSVGNVWTPEIEDVFIPFERDTLTPDIIKKLNLTENDIKARLKVLEDGNTNKAEHLLSINSDGYFEEYTSNDVKHVSLPTRLVEILREGLDKYILVHNHPWDSSLSGADLNIAALPGVTRMFAHVATGSIYSVEQTQLLRDAIKYSPRKYGTLWNAMSISVRTINDILSPFNLGMNFKVLGIEEKLTIDNINELRKYWNRIASHLNCLLLNDAGVFKYTYHMDPKLEAFYAPLIKKARESKEWKLASKWIYREMFDDRDWKKE